MPDNKINDQESVFQDLSDQEIYGKKIKSVPATIKEIGVDVDHDFVDNIVDQGASSKLDIAKINSFTQISQNRDVVYQLLDTMADDPTIAAVLETYAEDATETNDSGRIVWCESDNSNVAKYVTFLLDTIRVDKYIYKWMYALCKYGDIYLRLYRQSDFEDKLFFKGDNNKKPLTEDITQEEKDLLTEDVVLKLYNDSDRYAHYLELVPNPAEMFELTRFGKSYAYIKANINTITKDADSMLTPYFKYQFNKRDIDVFEATSFVHACLDDGCSRSSEEIDIFIDNTNASTDEDSKVTYTVRRGQSLLYGAFKIWREMMLLENSMLLNRLSKSSIIRIIGVEVGDMDKNMVGPHLNGIKQLIEQKTALDTNKSMSEYTNPGPIENNIYVPTHNGIGAITTEQVGGDVNVTGLDDVDYFNSKLFGSLRVPRPYFGFTDDSTGFNGGTSLSIISSRYAKMVKRLQNTMLQALTDALNLMLLDKKLDSYVNKFTLHMLPPTTQEEIDRRDNLSSKVQITSDIMNLVDLVESDEAKLRILQSLLSNVVDDPKIISILQEQIDSLEEVEDLDLESFADDESLEDINLSNGNRSLDSAPIPNIPDDNPGIEAEDESSNALPTPAELNAGDFSDSNNDQL